MKSRNKKGQFFKGCKGIRKTHGKSETKLYGVWLAMRRRCYLPTATSYKDYGARGIRVCNSWHKFESFFSWASQSGYRAGLSIERKNVNGNYTPRNCCWIPMVDQTKNRRNNRTIATPQGRMLLSEAARRSGLSPDVLVNRIVYKWPVKKLFEPKGYRHWNRWRPRPGRVIAKSQK